VDRDGRERAARRREVHAAVAVEIAHATANAPIVARVVGAAKVPSPLPSRIETLPLPAFATAISRKLSTPPLKWPTTTQLGWLPTPMFTGAANVPGTMGLASRMEIELPDALATTRSGRSVAVEVAHGDRACARPPRESCGPARR
jgi:hypothetical protein